MTILVEKAGPILSSGTQTIEKLSRGTECIVVDSITEQTCSRPKQSVIAFLSACQRLGNNGGTIFEQSTRMSSNRRCSFVCVLCETSI